MFVESLKRLHAKQLITDEQLQTLINNGKITHEEMDFIKMN